MTLASIAIVLGEYYFRGVVFREHSLATSVILVVCVGVRMLFRREGNPRKKVLARLRAPHHLPPPSGTSPVSNWVPSDWARAVALHGGMALSGTMFHDYVALLGYVP